MITFIALALLILTLILFKKKKSLQYQKLNIEQLEELKKEKNIVLIDSRGLSFSSTSTIENSISIPDIEFNKYSHLLPNNKSIPIIFYCRDRKCKLSGRSAIKAIKQGYLNVYVFTEGIDGWNRYKEIVPKENLSIRDKSLTEDNFKQFYRANKENILLVDVNDKKDYQKGHLKDALSMPLGEIPGKYMKLPKNKIILFYCETGIKSSEAASFILDTSFFNPEKIFFLKATVSFSSEGKVKFGAIEPL